MKRNAQRPKLAAAYLSVGIGIENEVPWVTLADAVATNRLTPTSTMLVMSSPSWIFLAIYSPRLGGRTSTGRADAQPLALG